MKKLIQTIEVIEYNGNNIEEIKNIEGVFSVVEKELGNLWVYTRYSFSTCNIVKGDIIIIKRNNTSVFQVNRDNDFYNKWKELK